MKFAILIPLLGLSFSAHAFRITKKEVLAKKHSGVVSLKPFDQSGTTPGQPIPQPIPNPLPQLEPTRLGRMKYSISKVQIIKMPDGSYSWSNTRVCTGESEVRVWDLRGVSDGYMNWGPGTNCTSTQDGQPVTINISSAMYVADFFTMSESTSRLEKWGNAMFKVIDSAGAVNVMGFSDGVGTIDISNRSLMGVLNATFQICSPSNQEGGGACQPNVGEHFSAVFELIDNP